MKEIKAISGRSGPRDGGGLIMRRLIIVLAMVIALFAFVGYGEAKKKMNIIIKMWDGGGRSMRIQDPTYWKIRTSGILECKDEFGNEYFSSHFFVNRYE